MLQFTKCIKEIKNTQIDNVKGIDVMSMYNVIEYRNNYSKTSGSLWQYFRDELGLNNAGGPVDFPGNSVLFKFR